MIGTALANLANSILAGGLASAAVKPAVKTETNNKVDLLDDTKKETAEDRVELTQKEKEELEYLLIAGGLSTKEAKRALSGDTIPRSKLKDFDRDVLKQIADITGAKDYSDFIYDGDKLGKGYTVIPLSKPNKPKVETIPTDDKEKGSGTLTTEGEEAKDKTTVTKGEKSESKDTVMEIPEQDLISLIKAASRKGIPDWSSSIIDDFCYKTGRNKRAVLKQLQDYWNAQHQKQLEEDLAKTDNKRVSYESKIKSDKYKKDTEEAAKKYRAENPDYKWDDVKAKKEAAGEEYTGERHSGAPSEKAIEKADDFVMKNAGSDYKDRLRLAKDYANIWERYK